MLELALNLIIMTMIILLYDIYTSRYRKRKVRKCKTPPLIIGVEIVEDEVTPTLIESIGNMNLAMKRKMIALIEDGSIEEYFLLQRNIFDNNRFILELFQYDEQLRKHLNYEKEDMVIKSKVEASLKEGLIKTKQQRLDV